jgi:hypothetical protein
MRFEHILQVYWSKGFFFGGKLFYINKLYFNDIFRYHLYGFSFKFKQLFIQRFELTTFVSYYINLFSLIQYFTKTYKNLIKPINIIFSQINSVNSSLTKLKTLHIVRKYLLRTYQGYCHYVGKPVRGQRTWSNGWNSFKCNNTLRNFTTKLKQLKSLQHNKGLVKVDYKSVKKNTSRQA